MPWCERCDEQLEEADLTDDDYAHMAKVVGYVRRHLKQGGPDDKARTNPAAAA